MAVKCILTGQTPSVLDGVTENVQTQIDAKAADNAVVHLAGNETISGTKTFTGGMVMKGGADVASSGNAVLNVEGVATDTDYIDMYVSGGTNKTRPLVLQNNSAGTGNVGIGTAIPSEKLEVVGNVKATKFKGDGSELTNVPYPVTSVAGKTGAVTLAKGDVGLGNVDNISDANKPISNATQAALNGKQAKITASGLLKGDGAGGVTTATKGTDYAGTSETVTATLLAASWIGSSAPYAYTLAVNGVTANSNQELLPALTITEEQLTALQAANIQDGGQAANSVTLTAFGDKPTIDLPIRVIVRGDS